MLVLDAHLLLSLHELSICARVGNGLKLIAICIEGFWRMIIELGVIAIMYVAEILMPKKSTTPHCVLTDHARDRRVIPLQAKGFDVLFAVSYAQKAFCPNDQPMSIGRLEAKASQKR